MCVLERMKKKQKKGAGPFSSSRKKGDLRFYLSLFAPLLCIFFFFWEEGSDGLIVCSLVLNNEEE